MPCDSNIQITLQLDAARIDVLDAAMKTLGYVKSERTNTWAKGLTLVFLKGNDLTVDTTVYGPANGEEIKSSIMRATSAEVVKRAAARNGWKLNWLADGKAEATKITYGR